MRYRILFACLALAAVLGAWQGAPSNPVDARVDALLSQLSVAEKISLLGGTRGGFYTVAIPRLGIPALKMSDGPMGVRNYGPSTAFPAGIGLAASWDTALAQRMGAAMGSDARARGVDVLLAPAMNIQRIAVNGRNFEYYGEDPYLAGQIAAHVVEGIQSQGVIATAKHFAANNQEYQRNSISAQVDERTLHEIYLPAFRAAVQQGHAWAVMAAYNKINGAYATENADLIRILKQDWGFQGILMSDWGATHDGVKAANAGLDLEMPSPRFMTAATLQPALAAGTVTQAALDDKVRRILRAEVAMGMLDRHADLSNAPKYSGASDQVALEGAREALVLLQNRNQTVPFDRSRIHSIAVFGPNADPAIYGGGGSAHVAPFRASSVLAGLIADARGVRIDYIPWQPQELAPIAADARFQGAAGGRGGLNAEYFSNPDLSGTPAVTRIDAQVNFARFPDVFGSPAPAAAGAFAGGSGGRGGGRGGPTLPFSARWQGTVAAPSDGEYEFRVGANRGARLWVGGNLVVDQWNNDQSGDFAAVVPLKKDQDVPVKLEFRSPAAGGASLEFGWHAKFTGASEAALAARDDAAVVAAGFGAVAPEGEGSDRSFTLSGGQDELIAAVARANPRTVVVLNSGGALDMSHWIDAVGGILEAWYPGQEGGEAVAEVLFGDVDPSGKLPATFERRWGDAAADSNYPGNDGVVEYNEGLAVGYRYFDTAATQPLFPFGYGLSYTTFAYRGLQVQSQGDGVEVRFEVKNTGARAGAEVAEVYVEPVKPGVPRPQKELKGFARLVLNPGEEHAANVTLDRSAFSYWDTATHAWKFDPGDYRIVVGASTSDARLTGALHLP